MIHTEYGNDGYKNQEKEIDKEKSLDIKLDMQGLEPLPILKKHEGKDDDKLGRTQ